MIRVSRFRRSDDLLFRGTFASISDIIPDSTVKEPCILQRPSRTGRGVRRAEER